MWIRKYCATMYIIDPAVKTDPARRWALPDRVFFAAGACHILTYAFLERYPDSGFSPVWIKPVKGYTGNHIVAVKENAAFDYHGHVGWQKLIGHMARKANLWWPGWHYELVPLPVDVLISEEKSRQFDDDLWLRGAKQYLHDALPRAHRFLDRFPASNHSS